MSEPCSTSWLESQVAEFSHLRDSYVRLGVALEDVLGIAASRHAPYSIVQTRAKKVPSFAEKCLRKCAKYSMPAHQLTDLCGSRLIARTANEVRAVSRFIEEQLDVDWENTDDVSERLSWAEFGYRSIHYVVSLRRDDDVIEADDDLFGFTCESAECPGHGTFHPLKAEIQVRTMAEHAWADFAHDITYKGAFTLPDHWLREVALMAADLEDFDRTVERIEEGLRTYAASYGAYMDPKRLADEIRTLEAVLTFDPEDVQLAWRIGKLAMTAGDWGKAVAVMSPFADLDAPEQSLQPLLRDLGVALRKNGDVEAGRHHLEAAVTLDPTDSDAIASLAGTWRGEDDDRAHELYLSAFEVDPTDYYPLLNYVEGEMERTGTTDVLAVLAPMAAQALDRCRAHVDVGINMPWSLSSLAKFHLLLGDPMAALEWYSLAVRSAASVFTVPDLARTRAFSGSIPGHEWCDRLLLLTRAGRFEDPEALEAVSAMASLDAGPLEGPVLIVAGGTDPRFEERIEGLRPVVLEALRGFSGTVISGGTTQGVCGMVGEARAAAGEGLRAIGYLPGALPENATVDDRYDELRRTEGDGFTPLDPLQNWIDLIAAGLDPTDVVVLGVGGGEIAAAEYRIALALGARVGVIEGSGREASRLLADPYWRDAAGLAPLPADPHTARAFVSAAAASLPEEERERLAREMHRTYREEIAAAAAGDESLRDWDELPDDLRRSNYAQADDIATKLAEIGCSVHPMGDDPSDFEFTADEMELLAEMEHGRWTAERLRSGWRWGPGRDPDAKLSPYLVPWTRVPDEIRDYDREFVKRIPELLATIGLGVVREG